MNYDRVCGQLLDRFEIELRGFVNEKMSDCIGENWWRSRVSQHIRSECARRQEIEGLQRFPRLKRVMDPIHYTNLGELKDIIVQRNNFKEVFECFFGHSANISTRVEELIGYRNPSAHNRPIFGLEEYQSIGATCRSILEAMEIELPPEFRANVETATSNETGEPEPGLTEIDDFGTKPKCVDNLPRPDYSDFFGRGNERREIIDHISHPRAWITVIDGIGGVGKTALALNCAEHITELSVAGESDFEFVIWASAKTERLNPRGIVELQPNFTDLSSLTRTILEVTGFGDSDPEEPIALIKEILAISKTLLVLDNLETVSDPDLYEFLQDVPPPSKVLATTRTRMEGSHKNLRLTALPNSDALELIRQLANDLDSQELSQEQEDTLIGLIDRVGGIPLAIKLAVGRIATGMPLSSYLDKLDSGVAQHDLLEFCFAESWNDLKQDAKSTLLAIILFSEEPSEAELRRVLGIPEMRLNEAIGILTRRAFLNRSYGSHRQTYLYSLLPLTADFVEQESEKYPELKSQIQDNYNNYLLEKGRFEEAIGQITYLLPRSPSVSEEEILSNMLVESAWRSYQGGDYREAAIRLDNATSYRDTAYLNHTWGVIERDEGRYGTAREKFRKAILLDENRLPTWRSWGKMEHRLSNLDNAVHCFSKVTGLPGSDPQDFHQLGVCLSRLANTKSGAERDSMRQQSERALKQGFYKNPIGYRETHHNVVNCHSLALTLDRLNRTNDALIQCRNGLRLEPNNERLMNLHFSLTRK